MKKLFTAFVVIIIYSTTACKKSKTEQLIFGVWVENSLRLDTLDFDIQNRIDATEPTVNFLSKPYNDTVLNPNFPVVHASMYNYSLTGDTLQLRSYFSSSTWFQHYHIAFSADRKMLSVAKFYNRRALPQIIEFEKIR